MGHVLSVHMSHCIWGACGPAVAMWMLKARFVGGVKGRCKLCDPIRTSCCQYSCDKQTVNAYKMIEILFTTYISIDISI